MDVIPFIQEQLGEIRAVLSGDSGDQCSFSIAHGYARSTPTAEWRGMTLPVSITGYTSGQAAGSKPNISSLTSAMFVGHSK